jgi:tRNA (guanine37-N1)-methyltransferase
MEERVREIFERQGFELSRDGGALLAEKEGLSKRIEVFSSESSSSVEPREGTDLVFVDEPLAGAAESCGAEVSVLREPDEQEFEMPSYELIGSVAVINELVDHSRDEAVEAITSQHPNVETVLLKTGPLQGEFRVGEYEKLWGDGTETVHTEFGCRFRVDPTEVYYSERFSTERNRVVSSIKPGERVLVMFAGVGPFAVMAARNAEPSGVVAVEKNTRAVEYMRENVEMNGVEDTVEVVEGDVREEVPGLDGEFDRVVMPLPESAIDYMDVVRGKVGEGAKVHLYNFAESRQEARDRLAELEGFSVEYLVECGDRGPASTRFAADLRVSQ